MPQEQRSPAYWIERPGVLEAVLIRDYTGDDANSRVIDLGDDYQRVEVRPADSRSGSADHLAIADAIGTVYGALVQNGLSEQATHNSMVDVDVLWQGKMTGADRNKIKLGSTGTNARGTNRSGYLYRIIAYKYSTIQP